MYFAYKCSVGFSLFRTAFALISARSPQLSRVAPRRAKNASGDLSSTVFMNTQSFLHHACRRPVPAACEAPSIAQLGHEYIYHFILYQFSDRRSGGMEFESNWWREMLIRAAGSAVDLGRPTCRERIHHACDTTRPATRGRTSVGLPEDRLPGEAL